MLLTTHNTEVGTVASWLVSLSPDRVIGDRALAQDIVLCSWVRHFTPPGGGGLPYMGYKGMCGPNGYGFSAASVINRVSILAILVINRVLIFAL